MGVTSRHGRSNADNNADMQLVSLRKPSEETQGFGCEEGYEKSPKTKAPASNLFSTRQIEFQGKLEHSKHVLKMECAHPKTL
jgi:hypothetical protein